MSNIKLFESKQVPSQWDKEKETWYFSIVDILTEQPTVDRAFYHSPTRQKLH